MTSKHKKCHLFSLGTGTLFLITYFLKDDLWEEIWFFFCCDSIIDFWNCFYCVFYFDYNRKGIIIGIIFLGIFSTSELMDSELFKSEKLLEATLMDDLSAIHLTLRVDNKFEMVSSNMFKDIYKGKYHILANRIIFEDERYSNHFIPDTLTIIGDRIFTRFDKRGIPVEDVATYFDLKKYKIENAP